MESKKEFDSLKDKLKKLRLSQKEAAEERQKTHRGS